MGRTNPTYRNFLKAFEDDFGDYRRALRRPYREPFDTMFAGARQFAGAAGYANHLDRNALVLFSMSHAQQYQLEQLEERVDELEARVDD